MSDIREEMIVQIETMFAELKRDIRRVIEVQRMLGAKLDAATGPAAGRPDTSCSGGPGRTDGA